jgi:hypothetical protein
MTGSNQRFRSVAVSVLIALAPGSVTAQPEGDTERLSGFWAVRFEATPSGQALLDALPEDVVLIDDTGGGELAAGEFGGVELTERALESVRNYEFADELKRENSCVAPSVAFYMQAPFPMEIYAGRDLIVFKMEYFDLYRVVFMDGRDHPPSDAPHFKSGHSVGRWEGDTLVVDTTHIAPGTFMNNGFDHSEDLHLEERFLLSEDGSTLWATQVYEDPATFSGRTARYMAWSKRSGEYVYPYDCDPFYGE